MKTKKILFLAVAVGTAAVFNSCEKSKVDVSFNLDIANVYLVVDTTSQFGTVDLANTQFQSDLQQKLDDNNASINDIESITLTSADLVMVNPGSQNFDIVDKAYGLMSASGLSETQVAFLDPVPDGVTEIAMSTGDANLKEYLKQSVVNFRVTGTTNAPNTQADSIEARLTFKVKAKIDPL
ncbi:hypothetical protein BH11BAC2_BH11BAC2_08400 [soil metagenome]